MKKISFIGVYDKIDLILSVAKVLTVAGRKVLVVDTTAKQKSRYVVPVINPTKSYITEFEGIDVAVGFDSIDNIKQYLSLEENEKLEYDVILIDADSYDKIVEFNIQDSEKIYYVTSFDAYSLKKGIELLNQLQIPMHMTKLFFSKEMLKEESEYFDYLALGVKAEWSDDKLYFLLENGDQAAICENQRLSIEYKDNVSYIVDNIDSEIDEKKAKMIIKNL